MSRERVLSSSRSIFIGSILSKIFFLIGNVVLARILFPEDYGYLVLATLFYGLLQQIGNFGIELYFIQSTDILENEENKILSIIFKLRLIINLFLFVLQNLIVCIAFFYFQQKILSQLLFIFSFTYLIESVTSPQEALLKKKLEFTPIVKGNLIKDIVIVCARIILASSGWGPLTFAVAAIFGGISKSIYLTVKQKFSPDFGFWDRDIALKVFHFGKHVLFGSAGFYLIQQVDKIFISKFFSLKEVGYYNFAYSNASIPFTYLFSPQQQLILSYTATLKNNQIQLRQWLFKLSKYIALITLPLYLTLLLFSKDLISVIFGAKWLSSYVFFNYFIIYFIFNGALMPFNVLLTALGRPDINSKIVYGRIILLIPVLTFFSIHQSNINSYVIAFVSISTLFDFVKAEFGLRLMGDSLISLFVIDRQKIVLILYVLVVFIVFIFFNSFLEYILVSLVTIIYFVCLILSTDIKSDLKTILKR